ncbi:uncharacterized protein V1513DRAFT_240340 [Lipomyces chichibuensis]|uniref:uncharacterized protein n=1 Tax=Lipomyces chichibuensis TaxID=1546026 RepID=UPI0033430E30
MCLFGGATAQFSRAASLDVHFSAPASPPSTNHGHNIGTMDMQKDAQATGLNRRYTERMLAKAKKRLKEVDARLSLARSASITKSQGTLRNVSISGPVALQATSSHSQAKGSATTIRAIEDTQQQRQEPNAAQIQIEGKGLNEEIGESSRSRQAHPSSRSSQLKERSDGSWDTEPQYSHVDLLRQIEHQLMMENPLEFGMASSSSSVLRPIGGNEASQQQSQSQSMRRSTSEPVSITSMTQSPPISRSKALSTISGAEERTESPVATATHTYPIWGEEGRNASVTDDMVNLLKEVREFRGHVTEIKEGLKEATHETNVRTISVSSRDGPGKSEQDASAMSSPSLENYLRTSRFSLGSIVTDRSSFRPSRAQSVVLAYGRQQPSSVYIAPLQAQQIARDIEEKNSSQREPMSEVELATGSAQYKEQNITKQQYPELGITMESSSQGQQAEMKQVSLTEEDIPGLDVEKHRRGSSFSQRPLSRPRGPREFSGASSVDMSSYSSHGSPWVSASEPIIARKPVQPEPTAPQSIQGSSGKGSAVSYFSANEYPDVPPELPKKNPVRPVADAAHSSSNSSSSRPRQEQRRAQPEPPRHTRHRKSNSASDIRHPPYSCKKGSKGKSSRPYRERVVSTPVYDKPTNHQFFPSLFSDDKMLNFSWDQPPGSEFDDIIKLGMEHKRMLEKFIETLGKLSVEVSFDEKKREEGRRRMDNAMLALEGWI